MISVEGGPSPKSLASHNTQAQSEGHPLLHDCIGPGAGLDESQLSSLADQPPRLQRPRECRQQDR